jgi:uncharacterized protein (TIGR03663 family)
MKRPKRCVLLILAVTAVGAGLRIGFLQRRPMHGDEAVHAVKFGRLLEEGYYRYDPREYHGPTLNYFTLLSAGLAGRQDLTQVSESVLRAVPVFFGIAAVLLPVLLLDGLGGPAVVWAVILTAVSPVLVFYSRYYIQEMLLVCFSLGVIGCGYRYIRTRSILWLLAAGVFGGLCHATKETSVLVFGSMVLALLLTRASLIRHRGSCDAPAAADKFCQASRPIPARHILAGLVVGCAVSTLFYSSFLSNLHGVVDSVRAYFCYLQRAGCGRVHNHPWYYYLKMLLYSGGATGPVWSEAVIPGLAIVGFVVAVRPGYLPGVDISLLRFIGFYCLIVTAVYSIIPYKTPWCMLGFLEAMILLAGVAVAALLRAGRYILRSVTWVIILAGGVACLAWQAYLASYKFYADPRNPYVYAHPTEDVIAVARRIEQIAQVYPRGQPVHIEVICPENDYWPLPWYLRRFDRAGCIGWYDRVDEKMVPAPVIIASAVLEPAVIRKLYELPPPGQRSLYVPLFDRPIWLRPGVELRGYVRKDLADGLESLPVPAQW